MLKTSQLIFTDQTKLRPTLYSLECDVWKESMASVCEICYFPMAKNIYSGKLWCYWLGTWVYICTKLDFVMFKLLHHETLIYYRLSMVKSAFSWTLDPDLKLNFQDFRDYSNYSNIFRNYSNFRNTELFELYSNRIQFEFHH